jgi:O-antigen/teichoic acid export membrane protein
MLRAIGVKEYGVYIYISSILILAEVVLDFGITSSLGKQVSEKRCVNNYNLKFEIQSYFHLQLYIIIFGGVVLMIVKYLFFNNLFKYEHGFIFSLMAITVLFSVLFNFIKVALQSLLQFKLIAFIDFGESLLRSIGFMIVGFYFKSITSFVMITLVSYIILLIIAFVMLDRVLNKTLVIRNAIKYFSFFKSNFFSLLPRISIALNFLWLRIATRLFHELPILIIKKNYGLEIVGFIGVVRKLIDFSSIPFSVIGNALMVRVHEIKNNGTIINLWDMLMLLFTCGIIFSPIFIFLSEDILKLFFGGFSSYKNLILVLPILLISQIGLSLFAPASDFLGGLFRRNIFLSCLSMLQLPVFFLLFYFGQEAKTSFYLLVLVNAILFLGYLFISNYTLNGTMIIRISRPNRHLLWIIFVLLSFFISLFLCCEYSIHGSIFFLLYLFFCFVIFYSAKALRKVFTGLIKEF